MDNAVPPRIYEFLKQVVKHDIENYSINVHAPNKKGDGFLGDMCFVSLQHKNSEKILNFVVKQAVDSESARTTFPIKDIFANEIYFYTKVWPTFQQFQKTVSPLIDFDKIAECFAANSDERFENIIFENLKFKNFELYDKRKVFDKDHVNFVLREYGKFHALSFAYRTANPDKFLKLSKGIIDVYSQFIEVIPFRRTMAELQELCLESLQPGKDDEVIKKYKHYVENGIEIFSNSNKYEGNYSVILHGDCWSNNMMFKYDQFRKLIDMRFLDFQLSKVGNLVSDLSYFLYSGVSEEILAELDYYLRVYHNSLSKTLKLFHLDSEDVYPFEVLKNDWKQHCHLGFTMGLLIWKTKCTLEEDVVDFTDFKENVEDISDAFVAAKYDEDMFKKRTRDLILHMYNNDFL